MALCRRPAISVFYSLSLRWMLILLSCCLSYGTKTDFACLQEVRNSLKDPYGHLSNWDFTNKTEGSICRFTGIECWHPEENKVLNIKLGDMGLRGQFPLGLVKCSSLVGLYLNGNNLNGSLPKNISVVIKYVTELDLSDNDFSGEIPKNLSDCIYLNILNLDYNGFSGQIPLELGNLDRLKTFNVANNNLSGQVPHFEKDIVAKDDFAYNPGLCGAPMLGPCPAPPKKFHPGTAGVIAAGLSLLIVSTGVTLLYISRIKVKSSMLTREDFQDVQIFRFDKSIPKMTLGNLMKATNSFNCDNIIGSEVTGTMFKATLRNGTHLMVKRLPNLQQTEEDFLAEMRILGSLKHENLVPLIGFCATKKERFLVYKYMPNGNLYDQLHPLNPEPTIIGWPLRLKIAIGAAKGLAWLEQNGIHGKVSSKCILLDEGFEPKLCEFGLATLNNPSETHFDTFARGEFGHVALLAPEYSNMHNFGTVLLELITGRKPFQLANASESFKGSLVEWVYQLSRTNSDVLYSVADKSLLGKGVDDELSQFFGVACSCVLPEPNERPIMSQVQKLLRAMGERYSFCNTRGAHLASDLAVTCE